MNSIDATVRPNKFSATDHLVIMLDGRPLDLLIAGLLPPDHGGEGLIPTLLDALHDPTERAIVWSRALPSVGVKSNLPILMCPDDCDLWCTVILAEVEATQTAIHWHRLGLNATSAADYSSARVGETVEWFQYVGPFTFPRDQYERLLERFRGELAAPAV